MRYPEFNFEQPFAPNSRLWAYMADRALRPDELDFLRSALRQFTHEWTAHNQALKADATIFDQRVVWLVADESQTDASGCSIDKSVRALEHWGRQLNLDFFDRMLFAAWIEGSILYMNRSELEQYVNSGVITDNTLMFNTLVSKLSDLNDQLWVPFGQSWHRRLV
jgi:hypothetical protein